MSEKILKLKKLIRGFLKDPLFLHHWEWDHYTRHDNDDQLSVRVVPLRRRRDRFAYTGSAWMFIEDFHTGIAPFMLSRTDRTKYPITIDPLSPTMERFIASGLSDRGVPTFLADAVCEFIRNTTQTLFQNGVAIYEIVCEKNNEGGITSFDLSWIEPSYLFKFLGNYYQIIPWWIAKDSHIKVQIIKIPQDKILRIDFPSKWGGGGKLKKILERLFKLTKEPVPAFQMDSMKKNQNIGFDFQEFLRGRYIEIAKLTRDFGWNQRQLSSDNITEHYLWQRYLREKRAEVAIRRLIVEKINGEVLNGPILNLETNIIADSILRDDVIDAQEENLFAENVSFTDIFNATKL